MNTPEILILGANGFVGRELLEVFSKNKIATRALVRTPSKIKNAPKNCEIYQGDLNEKESLEKAFEGIKVIYYLVHSMNQKESFQKIEEAQAKNINHFLTKEMRVIYLSGLGEGENLSEHIESRHHVGKILQESAAQVIELRASIIIGDGSLSFELMRGIVERFPVIMNTSWSKALCQPLSKNDLLEYLFQSKDIHLQEKNEMIEIGGPEKITYEGLLSRYAKLKNLKRPVLSVENLPKSFAAKAVDLFLPEYSTVGLHLLDSIEIATVANPVKSQNYFHFELTSLDDAILESIKNSDKKFETLDVKDILTMGINMSDLGSTVLKDEIKLTLPIKHETIIKILTRAQDLSKGMSFIPVKLPTLSQKDGTWILSLPSLEASENFVTFTIEESTLQGIHIFKPKRFFEAETFIIYQKSRDKILDFFQTIITKFNRE